MYLGNLNAGEMFELVTNAPVQVTHSIRATAPDGRNYYSSYVIIPAVQNYAESYSFQTHGYVNVTSVINLQ